MFQCNWLSIGQDLKVLHALSSQHESLVPHVLGATAHQWRFLSAQLVEYQEGAGEAGGGRKQSYFVELWDVGEILSSTETLYHSVHSATVGHKLIVLHMRCYQCCRSMAQSRRCCL